LFLLQQFSSYSSKAVHFSEHRINIHLTKIFLKNRRLTNKAAAHSGHDGYEKEEEAVIVREQKANQLNPC